MACAKPVLMSAASEADNESFSSFTATDELVFKTDWL